VPLLAAGVAIVLWASAFPGIRAGLRAYSPTHLALLRYLVASLALAGFAMMTRMRFPRWRDLLGIALLGLVGVTYYNVALNMGEVRVPAAIASFLIGFGPILLALEARLWLGERVRRWGWGGILTSFIGIIVIALSGNKGLALNPSVLLVLSAALAQSLYFVGQKSLLTRYTAIELTTYAIWAGTCFLLLFLPGLLGAVRAAPLSLTLTTVYLGIFPGAIGFVCWTYALAHLPTAHVASFLFLTPLVALGVAWIWLGELPAPLALFGGALVLLGVLVVRFQRRS
jgi:drug/metabolite transporter (DMT)-like permease